METRSPSRARCELTRRQVLGGAAAGLACALGPDARAAAPSGSPRRLIYLMLSGGASQLETWDPKPESATGGPFGAVETSVSGVRFSSLLPRVALQARHLALWRGMDSFGFGNGHDGAGVLTGRRPEPDVRLPTLLETAARELPLPSASLPRYVVLETTDAFRYDAKSPAPEVRPVVSRGLGTHAGDDLPEVLARTGRPVSDRELSLYGGSTLGQHCLQARRLAEAGVPAVQVRHAWWDTHADHFRHARSLAGELDHALSGLLADLHNRGLLESTLVVVASEFGRSPEVNRYGGRDHWTRAWSVALAGCGVEGGTVHGRTSPDGAEVVEGRVTPAQFHRACLQALGIEGSRE